MVLTGTSKRKVTILTIRVDFYFDVIIRRCRTCDRSSLYRARVIVVFVVPVSGPMCISMTVVSFPVVIWPFVSRFFFGLDSVTGVLIRGVASRSSS